VQDNPENIAQNDTQRILKKIDKKTVLVSIGKQKEVNSDNEIITSEGKIYAGFSTNIQTSSLILRDVMQKQSSKFKDKNISKRYRN
jgi:hypothetical protein